jgi:hypothetical protein
MRRLAQTNNPIATKNKKSLLAYGCLPGAYKRRGPVSGKVCFASKETAAPIGARLITESTQRPFCACFLWQLDCWFDPVPLVAASPRCVLRGEFFKVSSIARKQDNANYHALWNIRGSIVDFLLRFPPFHAASFRFHFPIDASANPVRWRPASVFRFSRTLDTKKLRAAGQGAAGQGSGPGAASDRAPPHPRRTPPGLSLPKTLRKKTFAQKRSAKNALGC